MQIIIVEVCNANLPGENIYCLNRNGYATSATEDGRWKRPFRRFLAIQDATRVSTTTDLPTICHIYWRLILLLHKSSMEELLYEIPLETQNGIILQPDLTWIETNHPQKGNDYLQCYLYTVHDV
jgi:hypothetical protein